MARLRDDSDFEQAIRRAAQQLELDPGFVEKDYWVTQALRALARRYGGAVVFKGGTSLSKGFKIIERFSEDVDVLIRPLWGQASARQREQRLKEITDYVAADLGVEWEPRRDPTRGKNASRADVLICPQHIKATVDVPREGDGVLLETGYGDGREPATAVLVTPMLCEPLEIDPSEYQDTEPFEIAALEPVRTLLEKVSLLHTTATRVEHEEPEARDARIGRHYHDIDRLLGHHQTVERLQESPDECAAILADIEVVSLSQYGAFTPRPEAGYAASPAFAPPAGSDLRRWLEARYNESAGLLPHLAPGKWKPFGNVLENVARHSDLL